MDKIDKFQTAFILLAVLVGLLSGQVDAISSHAGTLIIPLLMIMLFGLFLTINIQELKSSFLNTKFSISSLVINFIWTPVFAYFLAGFS